MEDTQIIRKEKRKYTLEDLKPGDMDLMKAACFLRSPYFICFSMSYYKLRGLGMINGDYIVTPYGYQVTKKYMELDQ